MTNGDSWIQPPPDEDYSDGNPPPHDWMLRPRTPTPPPGPPPGYLRSSTTYHAQRGLFGQDGTLLSFHIGSVGRRPDRVQQLALRSPVYFDMHHAIFLQVRFEVMPIPPHAMGVAYVNYRDSKWMFARREGSYHVAFRASAPPHDLLSMRLGDFTREAIRQVGTRRWNSSRWFYFHWDTTLYGANGELVL